jgi:hypothetical protein
VLINSEREGFVRRLASHINLFGVAITDDCHTLSELTKSNRRVYNIYVQVQFVVGTRAQIDAKKGYIVGKQLKW